MQKCRSYYIRNKKTVEVFFQGIQKFCNEKQTNKAYKVYLSNFCIYFSAKEPRADRSVYTLILQISTLRNICYTWNGVHLSVTILSGIMFRLFDSISSNIECDHREIRIS